MPTVRKARSKRLAEGISTGLADRRPAQWRRGRAGPRRVPRGWIREARAKGARADPPTRMRTGNRRPSEHPDESSGRSRIVSRVVSLLARADDDTLRQVESPRSDDGGPRSAQRAWLKADDTRTGKPGSGAAGAALRRPSRGSCGGPSRQAPVPSRTGVGTPRRLFFTVAEAVASERRRASSPPTVLDKATTNMARREPRPARGL